MISLTVSITVSAGCRLAGGVARMDRAGRARGDVYSWRLAPDIGRLFDFWFGGLCDFASQECKGFGGEPGVRNWRCVERGGDGHASYTAAQYRRMWARFGEFCTSTKVRIL